MFDKSITSEIEIDAPAETIWAILSDFESYPKWSQFIKSIDGKSEVGAPLSVCIHCEGQKPMTFAPQVQEMIPNVLLSWLGGMWGKKWLFLGEHFFNLTPIDENRTRLTHGENFSGWLLPLVWKAIGESTEKGFSHFNEALKKRAESAHAKVKTAEPAPLAP